MTTLLRPARQIWRRLTSMRTALILLFLLAVAAVPGSLLPQRPLNPSRVASYIKAHGGWGQFLDRLGMFDVFASPWFAAIYLLLFVSLVGCLVPRIRVHARALARQPLPAPKHLSRLPESGRFEVADAPAAYVDGARTALGRRWRTTERSEDGGVVTLSAEKGYSRETGNLLFHVSLLAALVLIAVGRLFMYQGTILVTQGDGFCSNPGYYDTWSPGRLASEGIVRPAPLCVVDVTKFTATYTSSGEATQFAADVRYREKPGAPIMQTTIQVNHPLRVEGDRVYLTGHGFSPEVTVRMPDGRTLTDIQPFLPADASTLYSQGVFKEQGAIGSNKDIGISGFFAPTPAETSPGIYTSISPQVRNPVLGMFVYEGSINPNGVPQSVYSLDTSHMRKIGAANLRVGQMKRFPNGVSVRFDGWKPYVNIQVSHDPAQGWLLLAAVAMVLGLGASLGVRRRRVWLRVTPASAGTDPSPTVVEVGGIARSDSGNFTTEFAELLDRLRAAGSPAAETLEPEPHDLDDPIGAGRD
jgi:cytochrome c biogenesis protein